MAATGVIQSMTCVAPGDAHGHRRDPAAGGQPPRRARARPSSGRAPRPASTRGPWSRSPPTRRSSRPTARRRRSTTRSASVPTRFFASEADAIARAASTLATGYIAEGRTAIPEIGAKWAPVGASNDPGGLNDNWTAGVGAYYSALGGDPSRPILLADQEAAPGVLRRRRATAGRPLTTAPPQDDPGRAAGGRGLGRRGPGGRGRERRPMDPIRPPAPPAIARRLRLPPRARPGRDRGVPRLLRRARHGRLRRGRATSAPSPSRAPPGDAGGRHGRGHPPRRATPPTARRASPSGSRRRAATRSATGRSRRTRRASARAPR